MKRPGLLAGIGLALAMLLVLLFAFPHQMIAPGALISGHARIQNDCFACHAPLRGASSTRCIVCHVPAQIGVRPTTGHLIDKVPKRPAFHAQLKELDCTACHSDHAANLFAGKRPMTFDHTLLNPAIARNCVSCHAKPKDALHAKIAEGCAQCHRTSGWKPANFAHDRYFKLDGEHNVACVTCHVGNAFKGYTCYGCHAHQPAQIAALHAEEGIRDIGDCVRCHRSTKGVEGDREDED